MTDICSFFAMEKKQRIIYLLNVRAVCCHSLTPTTAKLKKQLQIIIDYHCAA
jgi:hypothetical protein